MLSHPRFLLATSLIALLALGIVACGDDDDRDGGGSSGGVTVDDPYVRSATSDVAAGYFTIHGGEEGDRLIGVRSAIAAIGEVHEVITEGNAQRMEAVEGLDIPAGGSVVFEPGGYHVMLIDLDEPLEVGDEVEIILEFEQAGEVRVTAPVESFEERQDTQPDPHAPGGDDDHSDDHSGDDGEDDHAGDGETDESPTQDAQSLY